ncbi:hypothetical protein F442_14374 [Phytophthora nicotianae P10297]|uniref:SAYSvFN domain-containing protein n=1 Tax=Phytophthora nicotianae P10297 TaxID=1317064 RepID=W2YS54_PHYNI|nr:hypothetical protein F442_14374 [Phytophthora nicotianae P10297]
MLGDGPPPTEMLDAMSSYAESHQVQEILHILLTRLLETQPLDSLEFLIQTLQKDDQLDALEKKAALQRFDLRREKTKKQLVLQLYKRLMALQRTQHTDKLEAQGVHLARGFLTSQLRLDATRCHMQKLFPSHYRDLIAWFIAHEGELPAAIPAEQFTKTCMQVLRMQASAICGLVKMDRPMPRRMRAADQGPLDWLVPFIPPVLRVNRDTRAKIRRKVEQLLSKETLESVALALRPHWRSLASYSLVTSVWIGGLMYIHDNEPEFAAAYVILSGFAVLCYHLLVGGESRAEGMSAYSVFNRGAQRMLGSLSAEQFENEIRHRQPGYEDAPIPRRPGGAAQALDHHDEVYDEDDPELLEALKLSLQEKKREARRARRTSRRK